MTEVLVGCAVTATIAWCSWISMTLIYQGKELAVLKNASVMNKELYELLKARLT